MEHIRQDIVDPDKNRDHRPDRDGNRSQDEQPLKEKPEKDSGYFAEGHVWQFRR